MSQRGLEALLRPKSIAVIGASMKPDRAGYLMMRNLLAGGFNGPVMPVTPAYKAVQGYLHGLMFRACLSYPIWPYSVQMRNVTRNYWNRSARKGVRPALSSHLLLNSSPSFWRAPAAIKCVFLGRTVWDYSPLARTECQLFSSADP